MTRIGSLFTGYGGLDLAAQAVLGGEVAWHSDIKPAAEQFLEHRHPDVPNIGDIVRMFPADGPVPREALDLAVDILVGGWPCQPHSSAGKRLGEDDPRALWPNVRRAIVELRPRLFLGENVARIASNGELRRAVRSLAEIGYVGAWRCVTAASVGAPHKRDRLFLVAVRADAAADTLGDGLAEHTERDGRAFGGEDSALGLDALRCDPRRADRLTLLPTPTASMTTGAGTSGRDGGLNLQTAVTLLPTPKASDGPKGGPGMRGSSGDIAMPSAAVLMEGRRWGQYAAAIERWEPIVGRPAPDPTMTSARTGRPQLAPAFVEWMMGLPPGWVTDVPGLTRNQQLSMLGDGVVPLQATVAYQRLLRELFSAMPEPEEEAA